MPSIHPSIQGLFRAFIISLPGWTPSPRCPCWKLPQLPPDQQERRISSWFPWWVFRGWAPWRPIPRPFPLLEPPLLGGKAGRSGQVAFTGKAPVHQRSQRSPNRRIKWDLSHLPNRWQSTDTQIKGISPHPRQFDDRAWKVGKEYSVAADGLEMSPKNSVPAP